MKKINPWVVLLLNIVTFGIYSLFWTINRRAEMVTTYKQKIPHWWWLLLPSLILLSTALIFLFVFVIAYDNESLPALIVVSAVISIIVALAAIVIAIWWAWQFLKASEYVTNGRAPAGWMMAVAIFASPLHTLFLQYYFNKAEAPVKLATMPKAGPSRNFIVLAVLAIIAGITFGNSSRDALQNRSTDDGYRGDDSSQQDDGFYDRYY